jgi:hypothetical protein
LNHKFYGQQVFSTMEILWFCRNVAYLFHQNQSGWWHCICTWSLQ